MQDACTILRKKQPDVDSNNIKKPGIKPKLATVDITDLDVYEDLKQEAVLANTSFRDFANQQFAYMVAKNRFMRRYMPKLKKLAFSEGILFIEDKDEDVQVAKVGLSHEEGLVHCTLCESDTCIHVMFALALPELGRLKQLKPKTNPE